MSFARQCFSVDFFGSNSVLVLTVCCFLPLFCDVWECPGGLVVAEQAPVRYSLRSGALGAEGRLFRDYFRD